MRVLARTHRTALLNQNQGKWPRIRRRRRRFRWSLTGISGILRVTDPPLDASPQVSPFLSPTLGLVSAPGVHAAFMQGGHAACTHPLLQLQAMVGQKRREIWCEQGGNAANSGAG